MLRVHRSLCILAAVRQLFTLIVVGSGLLLACGADDVGGTTPATSGGGRALSPSPKNGVATFYDADGSGNCSFEKSPNDLDVVALAMPGYDGSASCGACLLVKGPKGEVTVRVTDSCPGCAGNGLDLDLSAQAFAKIAEPKEGRVPVTYQLVSCATTGNIAYHFKDGSSKWWTAIQIRNHRVPVTKVEYRKDGAWVAMERASYNYFLATNGVGDQPNGLSLRVTATDGQVVEETLAGGVEAEKTVTGAKQFQ
jgi:expansin